MRAASHEVTLRQPTAGGALSPFAASLEFCLCPTARRIPARRSLGAIPHTYGLTSERLSFVRRTPRACHGACDRLRPRQAPRQSRGLLGVSLAPTALCARKEEADIECVSTTGRVLAKSFVMQGDFFGTQTVLFGISATSQRCFPQLSPRNSNRNATANNALQRTAPAVTVAAILARTSLVRSWRCLTSVASFFAPPSQLPRQPPRSLSFGSLAVSSRYL